MVTAKIGTVMRCCMQDDVKQEKTVNRLRKLRMTKNEEGSLCCSMPRQDVIQLL